jgi:hypothetical protein
MHLPERHVSHSDPQPYVLPKGQQSRTQRAMDVDRRSRKRSLSVKENIETLSSFDYPPVVLLAEFG